MSDLWQIVSTKYTILVLVHLLIVLCELFIVLLFGLYELFIVLLIYCVNCLFYC